MSIRDDGMNEDLQDCPPSSGTESSRFTESRSSYATPPRQPSKALLEKRRQDLHKVSSLEQAYLRNSKKPVCYHPMQQQQQQHMSDNILKVIKTTHSYRIQQLENEVSANQIKINEYVTEIRTMKTQQKRLEIEIKKYQGMAGNIPNFMRVHEEDVRTVQCELKKTKRQCTQLNQTIASREEEIRKLKQENERWRRLEDLRQLEDRGKLHERNEELREEIARQNEKIMMLTRKGMLEVKNLKHELGNERKKHRETQQNLSAALANVEKLRVELEMKQKHLTYNSLRFSSHPKKTAQNGLESISLINLTGNRYGSMRNQVKLDPELSSRYPKLSLGKSRNGLEMSNVSVHSNSNESRSGPLSAAFSTQQSLNQLAKKVSNNVSIRKSPTIPLSDIQSDDDECSNLSEEDIDLYSSSNSQKDSVITNSHKSVFGKRRDYAGASDSDSETQTLSNKSRQGGCSLPNLASPGVEVRDVSSNGQHSRQSEKSASCGGRRLSVESEMSTSHVGKLHSETLSSASHTLRHSSTESLKSASYGLGQSSKRSEKGSDQEEGQESTNYQTAVLKSERQHSMDENPLVSPGIDTYMEKCNDPSNPENDQSSSVLTESDSLAKIQGNLKSECAETLAEFQKNENRSEKVDKIKLQHEEYLNFTQNLKQEIDQVSKGKLLAALEAIDKGEDPAVLEALRRGPKQASIFTATTARTPAYEFDQVTEDLYRGRQTKHDKSPERTVEITALDRFKSGSPLENPKTKADLMKELFGVGNEMDHTPRAMLDVVAPNRSIAYEPIMFSDRNNNEPDGDGFYPSTKVSLTNWKH